MLGKYPSKVRPQITGGDAGGILNCAQALIRNAILVPTRYCSLIDIELSSQVDEAETAIFQELGKRHAELVAQLTTKVNRLG